VRKVINLTLPLYPGMPVGNVWAWDTPFKQEPIVSLERNGVRIDALSLHSGDRDAAHDGRHYRRQGANRGPD